MESAFSLSTLSWHEAFFRVALALLFGFLLGYDRDQKSKPIDFRVYMIVGATTCLLAIMGEELLVDYSSGPENTELGLLRIVQGVLAGTGFLGAGAIIKSRDRQEIIGTATGASIWGAGAMGLMAGFGLYGLSVLGFSTLIIILVVFGRLKKPLFGETDKNEKS